MWEAKEKQKLRRPEKIAWKNGERYYIGQNKIATTKNFGVDDSFMFIFSV